MNILFKKYRFAIPVMLWLVLSLLVLFLWNQNQQGVKNANRAKAEDTAQLIAQQIQGAVNQNIDRLNNLKSRLEVTNGGYFDYWYFDALQIIEQESSFDFIEWIDSTMVIQIVVPEEGNEEAIGLDISQLDYRRDDWLSAKEDSLFNLTHWLELVQGENAFLVDAPVYFNDEFQGTITAGMNFGTQFDNMLLGLDNYHLKVKDTQGTYFYHFGDSSGTETFSDLEIQKVINIHGAGSDQWQLCLIPNIHFQEEQFIVSSYINLGLGLVLSLFVAIIFYFMQVAFHAQNQTRRANERIRGLIESSPLAIYAIDMNGVVRDFWNKAAEEVLGWTKEETIGNFLPHVAQENREEFRHLMESRLKDGNILNKEIVRHRKDGSAITLRLSVGQIVGENPDKQLMLVTLEDITKEVEYKHKLENSIKEKEVLLSEIHHRVKNNLAIVAGLIELQAEGQENKKLVEALQETQNRIYSIAGVHELLYNTESFTEISFQDYANTLVDKMQQMYNTEEKGIQFNFQFNAHIININQAIPLGLILNELISNSIKHAFVEKKRGTINMNLSEEGKSLKLTYLDDGKGMDMKEFESSKTLGLTLIKTLLNQLNAKHTFKMENGFQVTIIFPKKGKGSHSNYG